MILEKQVNKKHYFRKKYDDLNRFISYFYQIELATPPHVKTILEVGKGNGTVSDYLKKLGFTVTTVDIDPDLKPDYVADIRKLPFPDANFNLVMACEVLEHLPFDDFEPALKALHRVSSSFVLISLPYRSTGFELALKFPGIRTLFRTNFLDLFLRLPLKFGGFRVSGQHHWEIDGFKYRLGRIKKIIKRHFAIIRTARPVLNYYHYFFLLEKKVV